MKAKEYNKIEFLKRLKKENYSFYHSYHRIDEVQEAVSLNYLLPTSDFPAPVKVKDVDFILFKTKGVGIVVDIVCMHNENKFEMYKMNDKTYKEYEEFMKNCDL
jgi:hypothetical protein